MVPNFVVVPRQPRDGGLPYEHVSATISKAWHLDPKFQFWVNAMIGSRQLKPDAGEIRALVENGIRLVTGLLTLLECHPRWNQLNSYIEPIRSALYDMEAVKTRPHRELCWYAWRMFRALYELHDLFHAIDVNPEDFTHRAIHDSYGPFIPVAFRELIEWGVIF